MPNRRPGFEHRRIWLEGFDHLSIISCLEVPKSERSCLIHPYVHSLILISMPLEENAFLRRQIAARKNNTLAVTYEHVLCTRGHIATSLKY